MTRLGIFILVAAIDSSRFWRLSSLICFLAFACTFIFFNPNLAFYLVNLFFYGGLEDMRLMTIKLTELSVVYLLTPFPARREKETKPIKLSSLFVSGFADGEGSFVVGIYKSSMYRTSRQVYSVFVIRLHIKDLDLLKQIQSFFGVGNIQIRNDYAEYYVKSIKDLINVIIPHFVKYPLLTQKRADFELFKQIVELMSCKEHLTMEGLRKIITFFYIKIKNLYPFLLRRGDIYIYIKLKHL